MKAKEGDLVYVLDAAGEEVGLGLFIRLTKPGDDRQRCLRFFEEGRVCGNFWHWEILMNGMINWLPADHFSLIPIIDPNQDLF
jgi:hypothetical protein